jgi:hypothetical protein
LSGIGNGNYACAVKPIRTQRNGLNNIEIMETGKKKRMTASEKRFAKEMQTLLKMSLSELMVVERKRMPIGV